MDGQAPTSEEPCQIKQGSGSVGRAFWNPRDAFDALVDCQRGERGGMRRSFDTRQSWTLSISKCEVEFVVNS